jgi:DNA-binding transcriptional ArsR family regulator
VAQTTAERHWFVHGVLGPGALSLMVAWPKVGKSELLFGAVAAIEHGDPFIGLKTAPTRAVLLTEERPPTLAEKQARWGISDDALTVLMRHETYGIEWSEVVASAVDACREVGAGILAVDTFHEWAGLAGDSENNAGAVLERLQPLQEAAAIGLAVIALGHNRKSGGRHGEGVRGSNAFVGGVDIILELERPKAETLNASQRLLYGTSRFAATPQELVIELTTDGYECRGEGFAAKSDAEREAIRELLGTIGRPVTAKELSEQSDFGERQARRHLEALYESERINRAGDGKRNDPYRYAALLTPAESVKDSAGVNQPAASLFGAER